MATTQIYTHVSSERLRAAYQPGPPPRLTRLAGPRGRRDGRAGGCRPFGRRAPTRPRTAPAEAGATRRVRRRRGRRQPSGGTRRTGRRRPGTAGRGRPRPRSQPQCRHAAGKQWEPATSSRPIGAPAATRSPTATVARTGSYVVRVAPWPTTTTPRPAIRPAKRIVPGQGGADHGHRVPDQVHAPVTGTPSRVGRVERAATAGRGDSGHSPRGVSRAAAAGGAGSAAGTGTRRAAGTGAAGGQAGSGVASCGREWRRAGPPARCRRTACGQPSGPGACARKPGRARIRSAGAR